MPSDRMTEILQNAHTVVFLTPEQNNNIATVYILFYDMNIAQALYEEVIRVNKLNEQYFGFKKSHSSLILSFILRNENRAHATMLLDYNEAEFDTFIKCVPATANYLVLFGQMEDGDRLAASPGNQSEPLTFDGYKY